MFYPRPVRLFHSNLLIAILSLFVFTGFTHDVLGSCCEGKKQELAAQGQTTPGKNIPAQNNNCQCLCHQFFTAHAVTALSAAPVICAPANFVAHADEFPPDAVPVGIEVPPQLA